MPRSAPLPANEHERLARLKAMDVLDSGPEAIFDALASAAAAVCGMPIALISLVDENRQWFKSAIGLPGFTEMPRDIAFCAHAILGQDVMEVGDAADDERFFDNPLVTGPQQFRFYAGAPIVLPDGLVLGTLCVIDRVPRLLTEAQRTALGQLAVAAGRTFDFRETAIVSLVSSEAAEHYIDSLYRSTPVPMFSIDVNARFLTVNDRWLFETGYSREEVVGRSVLAFLTAASRESARTHGIPRFVETGDTDNLEYQVVCKDGSLIDVLVSSRLEHDEAGAPLRSMCVFDNITLRRRAEQALHEEKSRMARILEGTNAGTWELNVETGESRFNERWAAIAGYTLAELGPPSAQTWRRLLHPEDLPKVWALCADHVAGRVAYYDIECRVRHKDGAWIWVCDRGRISAGGDGTPSQWMHGTRTDITSQKRAVVALRASQGFLERVGEVAGVGGWDFDFVTGKLDWSDTTCRLHDAEPGYQATLERVLALYAPPSRRIVEDAFRLSMTYGKALDLELPMSSVTGRAMWAHVVGSVEFEDGRPRRLVGAFQDVTRRKQMENDLASSNALLQVTLDSIGEAVITTDTDGVVQWLNPVAERMTGWNKTDAAGASLSAVFVIVDDETRLPARDPVAECLQKADSVGTQGSATLVSRDGTEYGIEHSASPIREGDGQLRGSVLVFRDVSTQRRLNREMNHRATHDMLTGLLNRGEFETRLLDLLQNVASDDACNALLYIDLDQFKLVNDACGHAAGDALLRQVAAILRRCVHGHDWIARLGGDEFGVILHRCNVAHALGVAQRICDAMDEFRFAHEGRRFRVGTSIGLVPVDSRWTSIKALLQAADASCYAAKDGGRNRVHAWFDSDQSMQARHGDMQWVSRLEAAIDEDHFELFGQRIAPIATAGSNAAPHLHFEVLLRLRDTNGSLVAPGNFLPAAERFHLATRIDRWVVRQSFERMSVAVRDGIRVDLMSVNLSGQSLGDRVFHRDVIQMIRAAPFDPRKLCFEVTETAAITHMAEARTFIEAVRALGVKIALDDFGAGASSFGYLKSLPVDFLKIDGHFITSMLEDALNNAAVRCFCDVAKVVGVKTIAEFVERQDVCDALGRIGVDMAQGYLIHRPEPLATLLRCADA